MRYFEIMEAFYSIKNSVLGRVTLPIGNALGVHPNNDGWLSHSSEIKGIFERVVDIQYPSMK